MTDTPTFDDGERILRDTIAPGTTGDPNDPLGDFPADWGEPKRADDSNDPRDDEADQNGHDEGVAFFDQHPAAGEAAFGETKSSSHLDARDAGDDVAPPPPRRWLLSNQFCRRFLSGLVAPGSTGKTALRTLQCLALAIGRSLTGQHVFRRCRVLLVSFEDDEEEMRRKILAARLHYSITLDQVKGWLFYATHNRRMVQARRRAARQRQRRIS